MNGGGKQRKQEIFRQLTAHVGRVMMNVLPDDVGRSDIRLSPPSSPDRIASKNAFRINPRTTSQVPVCGFSITPDIPALVATSSRGSFFTTLVVPPMTAS